MDIFQLKPFEDCEVALHLRDGEVLRAKVAFVDFEYQDIVVNVLETNQPDHYKDPNASYTVAASDIVFANRVDLVKKLGFSQDWKSLLSNYINYANEFKRHAGENRHDINPLEAEGFLYLSGLLRALSFMGR